MKLINPNPFTTRPEIVGTFGVVASTHWIATAVGMGILERGGNAFDAAVATAFTLQVVEPHLCGPGGDVPLIFHAVKKGKTEVMCGQGVMPAKAHHRPLQGPGPRPHSRHRPVARRRARHVRRLHADAARLRHDEAFRRAGARHRLLPQRPSDGRARLGHHRHREGQFPRQLADLGRGLPAGQQGAEARRAVLQPGRRQRLPAHHQGSRGRRRQPRGSARARAQGVEPGLRRRGDRPLLHAPRSCMDVSGQRNKGLLRGEDMAKWQATVEDAAHLRLRPLHGVQGGPVGAEPGHPAEARSAERLQPRRRRSDLAGLHPHPRRGEQARLRRPRGLLRRSEIRRRADADAAVRRLQRRPAQADRSGEGLARPAAGQGRGLWRRGPAAQGRRQRVPPWRRAAPASPPSAAWAR